MELYIDFGKSWVDGGVSGREDDNDLLEKARSGIYQNTYENRKLNRVGQKYGNVSKEDGEKQEGGLDFSKYIDEIDAQSDFDGLQQTLEKTFKDILGREIPIQINKEKDGSGKEIIDIDSIKHHSKQLVIMYQKYPHQYHQYPLKKIVFGSTKKGLNKALENYGSVETRWFNTDGDELDIERDISGFRDRDQWSIGNVLQLNKIDIGGVNIAVKTGWWANCTEENYGKLSATHEFGHLVFQTDDYDGKMNENERIQKYYDGINNIYGDYVLDMESYIMGEDIDEDKFQNISKYANKGGIEEFHAECFSEWENYPKTKKMYVLKVKELFEIIFKNN